MNIVEVKKVFEIVLFCMYEFLLINDLKKLYVDFESEESSDINVEMIWQMFDELCIEWVDKGVEVVSLLIGWCFQSCKEMKVYLECLNLEKLLKYIWVMLEMLVIIVYCQLVMCGDIEEICGVVVNIQIICMLEDWGWIELIGYCDVLGWLVLFVMICKFLDDLGLSLLEELLLLQQVSGEVVVQGVLLELQVLEGGVVVLVEVEQEEGVGEDLIVGDVEEVGEVVVVEFVVMVEVIDVIVIVEVVEVEVLVQGNFVDDFEMLVV